MQSYLWVAAGSALGGVGRYWCTLLTARWAGESFPWGTLLVNVLGSALIGVVATLAWPDGRPLASGDLRLFLMAGVLGGFTTFSAFSMQTFALLHDGRWVHALLNVATSVSLCLAAVWLGYLLATMVNRLHGG